MADDDDEFLKRMTLAEPGAEFDARMDRVLRAGARATGGVILGLRHVFAASVFSAAAGAALAAAVLRQKTPDPMPVVTLEQPAPARREPVVSVRANPFDLSRSPIPLLMTDFPGDVEDSTRETQNIDNGNSRLGPNV